MLNQIRGRFVHVDLIRTIAIVGVIILHATGSWPTTIQQLTQLNLLGATGWSVVDIYQSLARLAVPLFIMLTGALLLQPEKNESLSAFFKKRWTRIGLPFIFWGAAYFVWDFSVVKIPFSFSAIVQGILNGPYTQFWYLYVLAGLYLLTPILRVFMAHAERSHIIYFAAIWFLGVAIAPFSSLLTGVQLNSNVFILTGYVGYFVLGAFLITVQMRRSTLSILMIAGIALTAFATYALAATIGGTNMYFFQQYFSPTIIFASVMVFMLLLTLKPPSVQKIATPGITNKLVTAIGQNTLAIFLLHVMILESIENGYFGFAINRNTLSPIIEVPLITAIVLFSSLGIILLLKKIPHLKKVIG